MTSLLSLTIIDFGLWYALSVTSARTEAKAALSLLYGAFLVHLRRCFVSSSSLFYSAHSRLSLF